MTIRTVSYGGGVQSTALLVLAAEGRIDYRTFLFANVGDDSEHPATLAYVNDVAAPYAEAHGIELVELHKMHHRGDRKGTKETLYGRLIREGSRSLPIPVRMSNGAPGSRSCTADFKIRVVARELKRRGATGDDPATVAIGISVDEIERAKPGIDPREPSQLRVYPLLDLGLHRRDCRDIIAAAGLPVPPKSSCYFCPFHDAEAWRRLKRETPDLFAKACDLEDLLNARRDALPCPGGGEPAVARIDGGAFPCDVCGGTGHITDPDDPENWDDFCVECIDGRRTIWVDIPIDPGASASCGRCAQQLVAAADGTIPPHGKDHVWFTRSAKPLRDTVDDQLTFDGMGDGCDSGWCMT